MNLNQVTIPATDLERSIAFYEMLGLKLIVRSLPNYARFECTAGEATFSLHKTTAPISNPDTWIYFEVEHLDDLATELQHKGILFDELPNDKPWLWKEARLKDPDGNQLIIYHAGHNRKYPPWRVQ